MKNNIKNVKWFKNDTSGSRSKAEIKQKTSKLRSEPFLIQEVKSFIAHLEEVFKVDVKPINESISNEIMNCLKNCKKWIRYQRCCTVYWSQIQ